MRFRGWLPYGGIALAAHIAVLTAMRRPPEVVPDTGGADATAVDLDVGENTAAEAVPAPTPTSLPSPDQATVASHATARAVRPISREATGEQTEVTESSPPKGVSRTGGLAEGLDARDASIGLGRGGPVVSALEVAAASSEAPDGNATFDVAIDSSGRVSVELLSATEASQAWGRVGAAASATLDPKRMRIPPGARGWHVVATVEAKVQYPNGTDPKKLGTHVDASASPALTVNEHRTSIEDPPIVFKKVPGVVVAHSGKVCSVSLSVGLSFLSGISGGCDPSNIGAHALRVVRSHVVSEGRL
jgi:hypothetical protein